MLTVIWSEPGGHLQWDEISIGKISQTLKDKYPRFLEIVHAAFDIGRGFSQFSPDVLYQKALETGMENVRKYDYLSLSTPVSNERIQSWNITGLSKLLPLAMINSKKESDPIVAQKKAADMIEELKGLFSKGVNGDWAFGVVVAQKPAA